MKLLRVEHLNIDFVSGKNVLPVVKDVSFEVDKGEILSLVGESGCGKSISCLALAGLLPSPPARVSSGSMEFEGRNLPSLSPRDLRKVRGGGIAYIFQEPSVSLNPVFRVGDQIGEVVSLHRPEIEDIRSEVVKLLEAVGIPAPEKRIDAYPHELSGGMQQRIMIAMALAGNPRLLVADEPTTALDVTIQAQILELIDRLRKEHGMGVILVTHNLGIVSRLADRVAVMYAGNLVETGPVREIIRHPRHPYTRALLAAVPKLSNRGEELHSIPGQVPSPEHFPKGCRFSDRCEHRKTLSPEWQKKCGEDVPDFYREGNCGCLCHAPLD